MVSALFVLGREMRYVHVMKLIFFLGKGEGNLSEIL